MTRKFDFKVIAFSLVPGLERLYFGKDKELLRLPTRNFSQSFKYNGSIPMIFFKKDKGTEEEDIYTPVASIRIPESCKEAILVFLSTSRKVAASTGKRFQILFIDGSQTQFPAGGRHFINLSSSNVMISIGEQKIQVRPKDSKTFLPASKTLEAGRVPVQVFFSQNNQWQLLSSTRWSMDPRVNTLVFIFEDPIRKRLSLRGITNRLGIKLPTEEEISDENNEP